MGEMPRGRRLPGHLARTADKVIRVCSAARAQSWRFGSFESPLMAVRRMASLPGSTCQA